MGHRNKTFFWVSYILWPDFFFSQHIKTAAETPPARCSGVKWSVPARSPPRAGQSDSLLAGQPHFIILIYGPGLARHCPDLFVP